MSEDNKAAPAAARPGVISLSIKERAALYMAYMPYVTDGGLFIPTSRQYRLGDEVYMLLTLMDDPARIAVAGKVVWITPAGAGGKRVQGIGVRFQKNESGIQLRNKIEGLLGGHLQQNVKPTHTF